MAFIDLPPELLSLIFVHLNFRDVLRCRELCARLKLFVDEDTGMRYKTELAAAGMEDGAHSTLSVAERLAALEERQSAWRKLAWRSQEDIPLPTNVCAWRLHGNVMTSTRHGNQRMLHFRQLPSPIRRIQGKVWTLDDLGVEFVDYVTDSTQDFLAIVEEIVQGTLYHLHLRSMATGLDHPGVASALLVHKLENGTGGLIFSMLSICGDHLSLLLPQTFRPSLVQSELIVWNWKTGALVLHVTALRCFAFTFLSPTHILVLTCLVDLQIGFDADDPCLVVLDLSTAPSKPVRLADIRYVCVFMYPTLAHNVRLYSMRLHAKPEPDWSPSQVPFSLSRSDRLLVVALDVVRQGAILSHCISHIPSSTLFSAMNTIAPGDSRRVFPWSDWGPSGSRLLCEGANLPPSRDVFGMSAASMLVISTYGSNLITYAIELYDFNPLAYRRALLSSNEGQDLGRGAGSGYAKDMLVMTPTTFTPCMEGFFAEDVTTYLPYLRRELEVTASYSKYVLPFDRLILGEDSLILMPCNYQDEPFYRALTF